VVAMVIFATVIIGDLLLEQEEYPAQQGEVVE
jgi:hypothetical protein